MHDPAPIEADSRGILHPARFQEAVQLTRFPPTEGLTGLIDRFWVVQWSLPPGEVHRQQVLAHPCANVSLGWAEGAWLAGLTTRVVTRELSGAGWNVAAMTTAGGLGAFLRVPAVQVTDRYDPLSDHLPVPPDLLATSACRSPADRVALLAAVLAAAVRPDRVDPARETAQISAHAERDRTLRTATDLARVAGCGLRTLQRMFRENVGASPGWVLRRYRLIDAAEAVRGGQEVDWADLARQLGYADQAHLIRDFRAATGTTPAAYARAQR